MPALALIGLKLMGFGRAIVTWLSHRSLAELALIALAIFAVVQHFALADARSEAARWHKQFNSEHAARAADRQAYERAQAEAKAKNLAEVHATEERYKRNNDEAVSTLTDRIARLRRELSQGGTATPQGAPGHSGSPQADNSGRTPGASGVCLTAEELLRAAENEERHDELIKLIRKQLEIQP